MALAVFVICAIAVLVQGISAQCLGNSLLAEDFALAGSPYGYANTRAYGTNYGTFGERVNAVAPTSGGGFQITSSSPISPTGIRVVSENTIDGGLSVVGELPFLSAVAFEAALPTVGAGGINYGCGNGAIGIVSEGIAPPVASAAGVASGRFGYGPGMAAPSYQASGLGLGGARYGYNGVGAMY